MSDQTLVNVCPECGISSAASKWKFCLVGCELCGDHPGIICPNCEYQIDLVLEKDFIEPEGRYSEL